MESRILINIDSGSMASCLLVLVTKSLLIMITNVGLLSVGSLNTLQWNLTHSGLVMQYGDIDLGRQWPR